MALEPATVPVLKAGRLLASTGWGVQEVRERGRVLGAVSCLSRNANSIFTESGLRFGSVTFEQHSICPTLKFASNVQLSYLIQLLVLPATHP